MCALTLIAAILAASNVHLALIYHDADTDRVNALGLVLMQAKRPLSESIHIMNLTVTRCQIDVELWDMMLRNLIEHWRFYPAISYLDKPHRSQWIVMQLATDELRQAITDITQACSRRGVSLLDLTDAGLVSARSVRDTLMLIETAAFPRSITIGPDPKVTISDDNMRKAVEAARLLQAQLEELRKIVPA